MIVKTNQQKLIYIKQKNKLNQNAEVENFAEIGSFLEIIKQISNNVVREYFNCLT